MHVCLNFSPPEIKQTKTKNKPYQFLEELYSSSPRIIINSQNAHFHECNSVKEKKRFEGNCKKIKEIWFTKTGLLRSHLGIPGNKTPQ